MARPEATVELEVPFYHVDPLGVVWHGHYLAYMDAARTALLRARGLDVGELIGPRYRFMVIESGCRHVFPLRYGERVRVTARITEVQHRITIVYMLTNLTQARCAARGHTTLATLDADGRLLLETPDAIQRRLAE